MPEEDDDALGRMLGDRLKGAREDDTRGDSNDDTEPAGNTDSAQITQSTESTASTGSTGSTEAATPSEGESDPDTARSRSPFPLYVSADLKEDVQTRFERFNAQRTLDGDPQVEKHKHFMEGLLRAGLDHPDLEAYVLEEFEER